MVVFFVKSIENTNQKMDANVQI